MVRIATLRQLVEELGDQECVLDRPLGEGALAEVTEAMRLLNAAGRRIDATQGALEACRVPFDVRPFRRIQDCLNDAYATLAPIPLAHAEAIARRSK